MYKEIEDRFKKLGLKEKQLKILNSKKYNDSGFYEFLINRMSKAEPVDSQSWLVLSLRYVFRSYQKTKKPSAIKYKNKISEKKSDSVKLYYSQKKEDDKSKSYKKDFDNLNILDREQYFIKAEKKFPNLKDFLIYSQALILYIEEKEKCLQ